MKTRLSEFTASLCAIASVANVAAIIIAAAAVIIIPVTSGGLFG